MFGFFIGIGVRDLGSRVILNEDLASWCDDDGLGAVVNGI